MLWKSFLGHVLKALKQMQNGRIFFQTPFMFISFLCRSVRSPAEYVRTCTSPCLLLACLLFLQERSQLCDISLQLSTFQFECSMRREEFLIFPQLSKKSYFFGALARTPLTDHIQFLMLIVSTSFSSKIFFPILAAKSLCQAIIVSCHKYYKLLHSLFNPHCPLRNQMTQKKGLNRGFNMLCQKKWQI